jgi:hypothetical protein
MALSSSGTWSLNLNAHQFWFYVVTKAGIAPGPFIVLLPVLVHSHIHDYPKMDVLLRLHCPTRAIVSVH